MDPDEALRELRLQAAAVTDLVDADQDVPEGLVAMAERFRTLDEWLSRGGFLPRDWEWARAQN